jgi:hypothetical protein
MKLLKSQLSAIALRTQVTLDLQFLNVDLTNEKAYSDEYGISFADKFNTEYSGIYY